MAIPPEPIDQVLPDATDAVVGAVARIVAKDPQKPLPKHEPGATDVGGEVARQVVELLVEEVLFGKLVARAGVRVEAEKPPGDYALAPGNRGPFLLRVASPGARPTILGRYGPDTYPVELIRAAAKKHGKK